MKNASPLSLTLFVYTYTYLYNPQEYLGLLLPFVLKNGNILFSGPKTGVVEVTPDKKVVWSYKAEKKQAIYALAGVAAAWVARAMGHGFANLSLIWTPLAALAMFTALAMPVLVRVCRQGYQLLTSEGASPEDTTDGSND